MTIPVTRVLRSGNEALPSFSMKVDVSQWTPGDFQRDVLAYMEQQDERPRRAPVAARRSS